MEACGGGVLVCGGGVVVCSGVWRRVEVCVCVGGWGLGEVVLDCVWTQRTLLSALCADAMGSGRGKHFLINSRSLLLPVPILITCCWPDKGPSSEPCHSLRSPQSLEGYISCERGQPQVKPPPLLLWLVPALVGPGRLAGAVWVVWSRARSRAFSPKPS